MHKSKCPKPGIKLGSNGERDPRRAWIPWIIPLLLAWPQYYVRVIIFINKRIRVIGFDICTGLIQRRRYAGRNFSSKINK